MVLWQLIFVSNSINTVGSRVTLLLDDLELISYPTGDPGLEIDLGFSDNPLTSWYVNSPYVNKTGFSHNGEKAINITTKDNVMISANRYLFFQVKPTYYYSFWWYVDSLPQTSSSSVMIRFNDEENHQVSYILGGGNNYVNDSYNVYYSVKAYNTTNSWVQTIRNIQTIRNVSLITTIVFLKH